MRLPPSLAQDPVGKGRGGAQKKKAAGAKRAEGKPASRPCGRAGHEETAGKPKPTVFKSHTANNCRRCKSKKIEKAVETVRNIAETPPSPPHPIPSQARRCAAQHRRVRLQRLRAEGPHARDGPPERGRVRQERGGGGGRKLCGSHAEPPQPGKDGPPGHP